MKHSVSKGLFNTALSTSDLVSGLDTVLLDGSPMALTATSVSGPSYLGTGTSAESANAAPKIPPPPTYVYTTAAEDLIQIESGFNPVAEYGLTRPASPTSHLQFGPDNWDGGIKNKDVFNPNFIPALMAASPFITLAVATDIANAINALPAGYPAKGVSQSSVNLADGYTMQIVNNLLLTSKAAQTLTDTETTAYNATQWQRLLTQYFQAGNLYAPVEQAMTNSALVRIVLPIMLNELANQGPGRVFGANASWSILLHKGTANINGTIFTIPANATPAQIIQIMGNTILSSKPANAGVRSEATRLLTDVAYSYYAANANGVDTSIFNNMKFTGTYGTLTIKTSTANGGELTFSGRTTGNQTGENGSITGTISFSSGVAQEAFKIVDQLANNETQVTNVLGNGPIQETVGIYQGNNLLSMQEFLNPILPNSLTTPFTDGPSFSYTYTIPDYYPLSLPDCVGDTLNEGWGVNGTIGGGTAANPNILNSNGGFDTNSLTGYGSMNFSVTPSQGGACSTTLGSNSNWGFNTTTPGQTSLAFGGSDSTADINDQQITLGAGSLGDDVVGQSNVITSGMTTGTFTVSDASVPGATDTLDVGASGGTYQFQLPGDPVINMLYGNLYVGVVNYALSALGYLNLLPGDTIGATGTFDVSTTGSAPATVNLGADTYITPETGELKFNLDGIDDTLNAALNGLTLFGITANGDANQIVDANFSSITLDGGSLSLNGYGNTETNYGTLIASGSGTQALGSDGELVLATAGTSFTDDSTQGTVQIEAAGTFLDAPDGGVTVDDSAGWGGSISGVDLDINALLGGNYALSGGGTFSGSGNTIDLTTPSTFDILGSGIIADILTSFSTLTGLSSGDTVVQLDPNNVQIPGLTNDFFSGNGFVLDQGANAAAAAVQGSATVNGTAGDAVLVGSSSNVTLATPGEEGILTGNDSDGSGKQNIFVIANYWSNPSSVVPQWGDIVGGSLNTVYTGPGGFSISGGVTLLIGSSADTASNTAVTLDTGASATIAPGTSIFVALDSGASVTAGNGVPIVAASYSSGTAQFGDDVIGTGTDGPTLYTGPGGYTLGGNVTVDATGTPQTDAFTVDPGTTAKFDTPVWATLNNSDTVTANNSVLMENSFANPSAGATSGVTAAGVDDSVYAGAGSLTLSTYGSSIYTSQGTALNLTGPTLGNSNVFLAPGEDVNVATTAAQYNSLFFYNATYDGSANSNQITFTDSENGNKSITSSDYYTYNNLSYYTSAITNYTSTGSIVDTVINLNGAAGNIIPGGSIVTWDAFPSALTGVSQYFSDPNGGGQMRIMSGFEDNGRYIVQDNYNVSYNGTTYALQEVVVDTSKNNLLLSDNLYSSTNVLQKVLGPSNWALQTAATEPAGKDFTSTGNGSQHNANTNTKSSGYSGSGHTDPDGKGLADGVAQITSGNTNPSYELIGYISGFGYTGTPATRPSGSALDNYTDTAAAENNFQLELYNSWVADDYGQGHVAVPSAAAAAQTLAAKFPTGSNAIAAPISPWAHEPANIVQSSANQADTKALAGIPASELTTLNGINSSDPLGIVSSNAETSAPKINHGSVNVVHETVSAPMSETVSTGIMATWTNGARSMTASSQALHLADHAEGTAAGRDFATSALATKAGAAPEISASSPPGTASSNPHQMTLSDMSAVAKELVANSAVQTQYTSPPEEQPGRMWYGGNVHAPSMTHHPVSCMALRAA